MLTITTSWDDGHMLDLRLAALLHKYGLKGTFYIAKEHLGAERLSDAQIIDLAKLEGNWHEVGAHTLHHPDLTTVSAPVAEAEISDGKKWLEELCHQPIEMFCYPKGRYNTSVAEAVKIAGFIGARTTRQFSLAVPTRPFAMDTTLQVYPFPFRWRSATQPYWRRLFDPIRERSPGIRSLGLPLSAYVSFESLTRAAFDKALTVGGVFHIWGHSWEIERYGMWSQLERVCRHIANYSDCQYLTNGEVIKKFHG